MLFKKHSYQNKTLATLKLYRSKKSWHPGPGPWWMARITQGACLAREPRIPGLQGIGWEKLMSEWGTARGAGTRYSPSWGCMSQPDTNLWLRTLGFQPSPPALFSPLEMSLCMLGIRCPSCPPQAAPVTADPGKPREAAQAAFRGA